MKTLYFVIPTQVQTKHISRQPGSFTCEHLFYGEEKFKILDLSSARCKQCLVDEGIKLKFWRVIKC